MFLSIKKTFDKYPHLYESKIIPAMGYGKKQIRDLAKTINIAKADLVVSGTPIDLARVFRDHHIHINKPIVRVRYDLDVSPNLFKRVLRKI